MLTKQYTLSQKNIKIGNKHIVNDFWKNPAHTKIKLNESIVLFSELAEDYFGGTLELNSKNSVYRDPSADTSGGARNSQHYYGRALDMAIKLPSGKYVDTLELAKFAEMQSERFRIRGIGVYAAARHIHVDVRPQKSITRWWIVTNGSNTPSFGITPTTFKLGHRSPAIIQIQKYLYDNGFMDKNARIDGVFGSVTVAAVKAFQKANNIVVDGCFGKQTNSVANLFKW